jgi:hypothetical protein
MNPSTIRSVVGLSGLGSAAVGLWQIEPAAALVGVGITLFVLAVVGELRSGGEHQEGQESAETG